MDPQKDGFLAAYDAYADALYRHSYFRVFSKEKAEEFVQEAYFRAWQYIADESHKPVENMRAFLYRILNNLIIDASRKKKEESLDAMLEISPALEPSDNGARGIEQEAMFHDVLRVVQLLNEEDRELITYRYVDDLDPKDIAEIYETNANNISVRLNRAVAKLKQELNPN